MPSINRTSSSLFRSRIVQVLAHGAIRWRIFKVWWRPERTNLVKRSWAKSSKTLGKMGGRSVELSNEFIVVKFSFDRSSLEKNPRVFVMFVASFDVFLVFWRRFWFVARRYRSRISNDICWSSRCLNLISLTDSHAETRLKLKNFQSSFFVDKNRIEIFNVKRILFSSSVFSRKIKLEWFLRQIYSKVAKSSEQARSSRLFMVSNQRAVLQRRD